MSSPRISIVVAAYNCERFLGETLRSVQAQSLEDWECIVVDDGSKDGARAVAESLAREDARIRVETKAHGGSTATRNFGFSLTNPDSKYVSFMDSDDLWTPEALRILSEAIEAHPDAAGAHGSGSCIDENGEPHTDPSYTLHWQGRFFCDKWGRLIKMNASEPTSFRSLWFSNPFPPGLVLARRSAYEKAGLFDTAMWAICPVEDWDMLVRLSRFGDFYFAGRTILSYRRHSSNLSGRSDAANRERLRALQHKTFFSPENSAEQQWILLGNWRATQLFHARQKLRAAMSHISEARYLRAAGALAGACVQFCRLARGYPARQGI